MPPTRYATGISQQVFASGSHKVSSKASKWQYQLKTLCGKLAAMEFLWKFSIQCFFFFFEELYQVLVYDKRYSTA